MDETTSTDQGGGMPVQQEVETQERRSAAPGNVSRKLNPADVHVGMRVRGRRTMLGLSQERLGERLGLTFQQVQNYERGVSRIGAGRLFEIAEVLGVSITYFFDGIEKQPNHELAESPIAEMVQIPGGVELAHAFCRIKAVNKRKVLLDVAQAMIDNPDPKVG